MIITSQNCNYPLANDSDVTKIPRQGVRDNTSGHEHTQYRLPVYEYLFDLAIRGFYSSKTHETNFGES